MQVTPSSTAANKVVYEIKGAVYIRLSIAETLLSRNASEILRGAENVREMAFPSSVTRVKGDAFLDRTLLRSVVLNEGFERLVDGNGSNIFGHAGLKMVTFPTTLREVQSNVFANCDKLRAAYVRDRC